jgi:hypothetical protein
MDQRKPLLSGRRLWLAAAAAFLLWSVAVYFAGVMMEHTGRQRDASAAEQRYVALDAQFQSARAELASHQSANDLLAANIWLCRATVALDNRNFGVAGSAVSNAVISLNRVDAAAAGLDAQALQAAIEQASGIQISVATNLASQRSQLIRLEGDIAALVASSAAMAGTSP